MSLRSTQKRRETKKRGILKNYLSTFYYCRLCVCVRGQEEASADLVCAVSFSGFLHGAVQRAAARQCSANRIISDEERVETLLRRKKTHSLSLKVQSVTKLGNTVAWRDRPLFIVCVCVCVVSIDNDPHTLNLWRGPKGLNLFFFFFFFFFFYNFIKNLGDL